MKSNFLFNTLKLSSAPVLTQLFSFLVLPFITRLYSPDDFGVFNIFLSYVGVITVFSGMGYHQAIVLPKKNKDGFTLFAISFLLTVIVCLISVLIIFITPYEIYVKFKIDSIFQYKHIICISIFFHGLYVTLLGWNLRFSNFGVISISRILRVFSNKTFIILCALFFAASPKFLIYGEVLGSVFVCLILLIYFNYNHFFIPNLKEIVRLSTLHKQFPLFNLPNDLIYRLKTAVIIGLLVYFFSTDLAGHFGMALLILAIPTSLLGSSIGEVYYQKIANINDSVVIQKVSIRIFKILCFVSFFGFTYIAFFSMDLLPLLLGNEWHQTGLIISILSFSLLLEFILGPFINLLKVIDKQQYLVYFQIFSIIFSTLSLVIGGLYNNIELAFILFSFLNGLNCLFIALIIFNFIKIKYSYILKILFTNICFITPFIFSFSLIKYNFSLNVFSILVITFFSIILYFLLIFNLNKDFKAEYKNFKTLLLNNVKLK